MTSDGGQFLQILHQARPVKCDTFCSKQLRKATSCKSPLSMSPDAFTCGYYDTARVYFVSGIWWRALKPSLDCLKTVSFKISIFSLFFFFLPWTFKLWRTSFNMRVCIYSHKSTCYSQKYNVAIHCAFPYERLHRIAWVLRHSYSYIFFLAAWMFMARNHVIPRC